VTRAQKVLFDGCPINQAIPDECSHPERNIIQANVSASRKGRSKLGGILLKERVGKCLSGNLAS
jgi:hypothetical protein